MKAVHPEALAVSRSNPGETLRKARENKNWSLADVAGQLNLTSQRLGQLEAGQFDQLPGHTFARGYVRAYAKLLGMDQTLIVQEFDQYTGTNATGSNVHGLGRIEEPMRLSQNLLRLVCFVLLLALAGGGFLWWQDQSASRGGETAGISLGHVEVDGADGTTEIHPLDEPEDQAVADAEDQGESAPAQVSPELAAQPEAQAATQAPAAPAAPAGSVAVPVAPTVAAPAPAAPVTPTAPVAPAPAAAPATPATPVVAGAGEGVVAIDFSANCWISLTDANGKVVVSGLKRAGEKLEVSGKAPLELRLGFARGAQVRYNGQPVDAAPFTSGETARIKLGQ
ncbi:RodZ domain-containing protein [Pseudomonas turukhanskensis]|uniref:Cro/Cl family transcriptional regulator n=1 Tax=Pseudomonas turukhanskensis TaxID=1806536 RepID=A0A9W6K351_9PSED|nr:RodZ family helix-turn-helix domain-containing protein [Pseudomonas turukhanskensis]GLK87917.1 Cro/Cl family transcriptional regulator [Pseudomonas turukhanskensis]